MHFTNMKKKSNNIDKI